MRNIALTAPYGHNGAFKTLKEVVAHQLDPLVSLHSFDYAKLQPTTEDGHGALDPVSENETERIAEANELKPIELNEKEMTYLEAFLHALTDKRNGQGRLGRPEPVPSALRLSGAYRIRVIAGRFAAG